MKLYFVRHGATRGNREHRYVGRTDEGILEMEKERLKKTGESLPPMDGIFLSPYLRCLQSAQALFDVWPEDDRSEIIEDFREMDFGEFEYKNYQELDGNPDYQKFIDSGGRIGFPGGESPADFKRRCRKAFLECIRRAQINCQEHVGFVIHGGTIMAIMEAFGYPQRGYYDYQVRNGCGYVVRLRETGNESEEPGSYGEYVKEGSLKKDSRENKMEKKAEIRLEIEKEIGE